MGHMTGFCKSETHAATGGAVVHGAPCQVFRRPDQHRLITQRCLHPGRRGCFIARAPTLGCVCGVASMDDDAARAEPSAEATSPGPPRCASGWQALCHSALGRSSGPLPQQPRLPQQLAKQTTLGASAQLAPATRLSARPQPKQGPTPRVPRMPRLPHLGATLKPLPCPPPGVPGDMQNDVGAVQITDKASKTFTILKDLVSVEARARPRCGQPQKD